MRGRTLRVDETTLITSRGKFAIVCIEVDLNKPLKVGYKLKGKLRKVQYIRDSICFVSIVVVMSIARTDAPRSPSLKAVILQCKSNRAMEVLSRVVNNLQHML